MKVNPLLEAEERRRVCRKGFIRTICIKLYLFFFMLYIHFSIFLAYALCFYHLQGLYNWPFTNMTMPDLQPVGFECFVWSCMKNIFMFFFVVFNYLFSIGVFLQKWLAHFLLIRKNAKIHRNKYFSRRYQIKILRVPLQIGN